MVTIAPTLLVPSERLGHCLGVEKELECWMEEDTDPSRAVALVMIPNKRKVEIMFVMMHMLLLVVVLEIL
jgi:hypothetical protein